MWNNKTSSTAFVLGNGKSRAQINARSLPGKIYGCNAIYREQNVEVLVSTDPGISEEIQKSGYALGNRHYTREPFDGSGSMKIEQHYYWSSGPIALNYACLDGHSDIYILGVDFGSPDGKFSNMYADTEHYKCSGEEPTFYGNWVNQFWEIMKNYPDKKFTRVIEEWCTVPDKWQELDNVSHISITDFVDTFFGKS